MSTYEHQKKISHDETWASLGEWTDIFHALQVKQKKIKLYKLRGLKANPQVDATATDFATSLLQFNF